MGDEKLATRADAQQVEGKGGGRGKPKLQWQIALSYQRVR